MALGFIQASERMAGAGGAFTDTLNRALRDLLSQSGYNPDASPFPGLSGPVFNVRAFGAVGNGIADDTVAFQNAIDAARAVGGVLYVPPGRYLLTAPLNLTFGSGDTAATRRPIMIRFEANTGLGQASDVSSAVLIAAHNGHVLDCSGSYDFVFDNVNIATKAGFTPKTGWFIVRNSLNSSAGKHTFRNCKAWGEFVNGVVYQYGSEENDYFSCRFANVYSVSTGARGVVNTGYNIDGLTSTFITVATGLQSNTVMNMYGGSVTVQTVNGKPIYLDAANGVNIFGTWMYAGSASADGFALIYVDTVNGESNDCMVLGVFGDPGTFKQQYGIYFGPSTGAPARTCRAWTIVGGSWATQTNFAAGHSSFTPENFRIDQIFEPVSKGINFNALRYSKIYGSFLLVTVTTTSTGNEYHGDPSRWTLPASTTDLKFDLVGGALNPGTALQIAGTKVVGARGAAVADVASANATDLATAITLVNELKAQVNTAFARLRSTTGHGLWT